MLLAPPRRPPARDGRAEADPPRVEADELRRAGLAALVLLAVLNLADVVLTRMLLRRGGIELNPLAERLLVSNVELVVKLGLVAVLAVHFVRFGPRLVVVCLMWMVAGVYALAVVVNGSQLLSVAR